MSDLPDYLPVRMLNEYAYCPRLFYYEFVEGLFVQSADTVEGTLQHKRVDKPGKSYKRKSSQDLDAEEKSATKSEIIHHRSLTLSSETLKIIAKMDLVEEEAGRLIPVDYKHARPYRMDIPDKSFEEASEDDGDEEERDEGEKAIQWAAWPNDAIQVCSQGLILRENGYNCPSGYVYYQASKQKIEVPFTDELMEETKRIVEDSRHCALQTSIPLPLKDSQKCPRCSLLPICMPEETGLLRESISNQQDSGIRRIITARDDEGVLYVNTQGARVYKSGSVLNVKCGYGIIADISLNSLRQVNLYGNVQMTVQALHEAMSLGVPICHFSMRGWFYGISHGLPLKNVDLRRRQFEAFGNPTAALAMARKVVQTKILNQRTFLMRNARNVDESVFQGMKDLAGKALEADSLSSLLGFEGNAARHYFGHFQYAIKAEVWTGAPGETPEGQERLPLPDFWEGRNIFDFEGRNRRPPKDPVNALLSLAYSVLVKDITVACYTVGFDPMYGFFHQPKFGRPALALDLMEEFRPLVADSVVLGLVNNRMLGSTHFIWGKSGCALTEKGRVVFFEAYEKRKNSLVTHPLFGYRISYGRLMEVQARLLAKHLQGEVPEYVGFTTR
jgi:CRISPR-associated protein Cas1